MSNKGFGLVIPSGAVLLLLSFVVFQGSSYVIQLIAAQQLGPSDFGKVRILESFLSIALILASFGMPSAIVTYVAAASSAKRQHELLFTAVLLVCLASVAVAAIVSLSPFFGLPQENKLRNLPILVWILPAMTASRTVVNYFQGRGEIKRLSVLNLSTSVATAVIVAGSVHLWAFNGWLYGRMLAEALFAVGLVIYARRHFAVFFRSETVRTLATFGAFAMPAFMVDRLLTMGDTLYLSWFLQRADASREIGNYGVASLAYTAVLLVPGAINGAVWPQIASRAADPAGAYRFTLRVVRRSTVLVALLCVVLFVSFPKVVPLVLGSGYDQAGRIFQILIPTAVAYTFCTTMGTLILAAGKPRLSLLGNAPSALFHFGLCALLIPRYGIEGAALALLITTVVRTLIFFGLVQFWLKGNEPKPEVLGSEMQKLLG
jgi:O-antigen/teichoic acid export membrane protein